MSIVGIFNSIAFQQPFVRLLRLNGQPLTMGGPTTLIDRMAENKFTFSVCPVYNLKWRIFKVVDGTPVGNEGSQANQTGICILALAAGTFPAGSTDYILRAWIDSTTVFASCEIELSTNP